MCERSTRLRGVNTACSVCVRQDGLVSGARRHSADSIQGNGYDSTIGSMALAQLRRPGTEISWLQC